MDGWSAGERERLLLLALRDDTAGIAARLALGMYALGLPAAWGVGGDRLLYVAIRNVTVSAAVGALNTWRAVEVAADTGVGVVLPDFPAGAATVFQARSRSSIHRQLRVLDSLADGELLASPRSARVVELLEQYRSGVITAQDAGRLLARSPASWRATFERAGGSIA